MPKRKQPKKPQPKQTKPPADLSREFIKIFKSPKYKQVVKSMMAYLKKSHGFDENILTDTALISEFTDTLQQAGVEKIGR